jgi:hypothetical protein
MLSLSALTSTHLVVQLVATIIYWSPVVLDVGLIGPIKFKPHFIKSSYAITGLSGHLPLRPMGSNHWQMSHF